MTRYRTIVADPPWEMPSGGPQAGTRVWNPGIPSALPYATLTVQEIAALPVLEMAARDAHLFIWTVNCHIEDAYTVAKMWGFRSTTLLTWAKRPRGLGLGGAFTQTTEHILFARKGCDVRTARTDTTWWEWKRGAHSAKPEAFLDVVERVSPGPYLEMFARRQRLGWDTWGDEALNHVSLGAAVTDSDPEPRKATGYRAKPDLPSDKARHRISDPGAAASLPRCGSARPDSSTVGCAPENGSSKGLGGGCPTARRNE